MFRITDGKGFQVTFPNGWTISVQFGAGNYCEHHHRMDYPPFRAVEGDVKSKDAEVAIFYRRDDYDPPQNVWYQIRDNDDVVGYVKPEELPSLMVLAAGLDRPKRNVKRDQHGPIDATQVS